MSKFLYVDIDPSTDAYRKPNACVINVDNISAMKEYDGVVTLTVGGDKMTIKGNIVDLLNMIRDVEK